MQKTCEAKNCSKEANYYFQEKARLCEYHKTVLKSLDYDNKIPEKQWKTCSWCGNKVERIVEHHFKYEPEATIEICDSCHQEIHSNQQHLLRPTDSQMDKKGVK